MLRHLMRLVWNRRRAGMLLVLEIFFSFLATCAVATLGLYCWDNYRRPLGFDHHDVWSVAISSQSRAVGGAPDAAASARLETLVREVGSLAPVIAVAAASKVPYGIGEDRATFAFERGPVTFNFSEVSRDFDRVLRLRPLAGRWFARGDDLLGWQPVVINRALARAVYQDEDPIGRRFGLPDRAGVEPERRVIGVVDDYREGGELAGSRPFLFGLHEPGARRGGSLSCLAIRVRPGTSAAFEDELVKRMQAAAPEWTFSVETLAEARDSYFRQRLALLLAGGLMAFFLLVMIGLGMVGVVWQNLLLRTREIGLRRAAGAARSAVRLQILFEQLLLATLGMAAGLVLVAQVPLLDAAGFLSGGVLAGGVALAMASIYLLVAASTLHPSILASRVQPAEALRFE
jgi:putative ABC transport system permease protein